MDTKHFYTNGNVPLEIWGQEGVFICTIWNGAPNTPIMLWGISQTLWDSLSDKGTEISLSVFAIEGSRFTLTNVQHSDWDLN